MIRSILLKHAGKYGCRAQTSADTVFAEAELLVRGEIGICQYTKILCIESSIEEFMFSSYWIILGKFSLGHYEIEQFLAEHEKWLQQVHIIIVLRQT